MYFMYKDTREQYKREQRIKEKIKSRYVNVIVQRLPRRNDIFKATKIKEYDDGVGRSQIWCFSNGETVISGFNNIHREFGEYSLIWFLNKYIYSKDQKRYA